MNIKRSLEVPKNQSFFLFGPRQTGKTTLLRGLFPADSFYYYDLLKTDEYLRLSAHPEIFRSEIQARHQKITHVIVDEVQRVPELLSEVHYLMEQPNPPYFILTGSSSRKLRRSKANLLAGRAFTYHLHPLTQQELGDAFSLNKVLRFGSLPSVYLEQSPELAADRLRAYVDTYLKEEIEIEAQIRNIGSFAHFLSLASAENGAIMNYSNIARDTGVSYQTIKSYFQILEDTLIGYMIFPFLKSTRRRISKHPKFYFFDPGVVRALTKKLTIPLEPRTPEFGRAFEHFVVLEIMRLADYHRLDYTFSYFRTQAGAGVDLIVEAPNGRISAIEIKGTDRIDQSHLRGLKIFASSVPSARLACVSTAERRRQIGGITILPVHELLEWLRSA